MAVPEGYLATLIKGNITMLQNCYIVIIPKIFLEVKFLLLVNSFPMIAPTSFLLTH